MTEQLTKEQYAAVFNILGTDELVRLMDAINTIAYTHQITLDHITGGDLNKCSMPNMLAAMADYVDFKKP